MEKDAETKSNCSDDTASCAGDDEIRQLNLGTETEEDAHLERDKQERLAELRCNETLLDDSDEKIDIKTDDSQVKPFENRIVLIVW